jgi:fluoroacetyl-CoA thioesterase
MGGADAGDRGSRLMPIQVGLRASQQCRVEPDMSADRWGNAGVMVLATPHLVGLFEGTAVLALRDHLEPGQSSVGTRVDIRHLKATPVGDTVTLTAEVTAVEGRRIDFSVKAEDSQGLVGEGAHERVLIDLERFLARSTERTKS